MTGQFSPVAIWPQRGSTVSFGTWLREMATLGVVTVWPPPFPDDAARGDGQPVIVVPGFCSPNISTRRLRQFLTRQGFAPQMWSCGVNLGPAPTVLTRLERQITETAERTGRRVSLVGVSLGGTMAREAAKLRPDCVAQVVTICSPVKLPVMTPLAPLAYLAGLRWDEEARRTLNRVGEPPPVPVTAIVNPKDGVLDWRNSLPERSAGVEVVMIEGAHMTMGSNPETQRVVATRLARQVGRAVPTHRTFTG
jgi:pimeloyl-ACP methyl ester carboxylesterase